MTTGQGHETEIVARYHDALEKLHHRRHQLLDWLHLEETSREGAHEWKANVLRGRLEEIEWAISLLRP